MNKSESISNLAKALSQFQGEVRNPANSANNPFFKSKYAPLNEILNDVRPLLAKHGLSVLQMPSGDGVNVIITTILMHESGEFIESEPLVLKAEKATAQGAGSAITYARRYAISAILGVSSEDDDDGNHASGNTDNKQQQQPPKQQAKPQPKTEEKVEFAKEIISLEQSKRLFAISKGNNELVKKVIGQYGYESSKAILKSDYEKISKEIETEVSKAS